MRQLTQQQTVSGNSPLTLTFPEAAGQTFERGAPVVLASGNVQEAASGATGVTSLVGIAAMPANGAGASRYLPPSTGQPVTVWVANDDTLFGVPATGLTQSAVGTLIQIVKTGSTWAGAAGASGVFMVMYLYTETQTGQVIAVGKFLESATQMMKAA